MKIEDSAARWERLTRLLAPFHERAQAVARNLSRETADGDDLFQEAVLRAHSKLSTLRAEESFRSWFFAVLLSVHRSRSRRAFWKRFIPLEDAPDGDRNLVGEDGHDTEEGVLAARRAARALSRLPAAQREAIVLYELEGFSMDEVAALQGVSTAAVKSRVQRARERLRRHYRALGRDNPRASEPTCLTVSPAYSSGPNHPSRPGGRHA